MQPNGVYLITPAFDHTNSWQELLQALVEAGIDMVQYRDKQPVDDTYIANVKQALTLMGSTALIINDHWTLLDEIPQLAGVHIGQADGDIAQVKTHIAALEKIRNRKYYCGLTCHSQIKYAQMGVNNSVDYVAFGRFFNSATKPTAQSIDFDQFETAMKFMQNYPAIKTIGIGGLDLDKLEKISTWNLNWIAVSSFLFPSEEALRDIPKLKALAEQLVNQWRDLTSK